MDLLGFDFDWSADRNEPPDFVDLSIAHGDTALCPVHVVLNRP